MYVTAIALLRFPIFGIVGRDSKTTAPVGVVILQTRSSGSHHSNGPIEMFCKVWSAEQLEVSLPRKKALRTDPYSEEVQAGEKPRTRKDVFSPSWAAFL